MKSEQELKDSLLNFAKTFASVIGTDETCSFLDTLTEFAQKNPETVLEIKQFVESDPKWIAELMTKEGIKNVKNTITMVKNMNFFS